MTRRRTTALQNPYKEAVERSEPGRAARAVTVTALAIGAALGGGILTGQAAHAQEADDETTCETDQYGRTVNSADGTPCATGSGADTPEPTSEVATDQGTGDTGSGATGSGADTPEPTSEVATDQATDDTGSGGSPEANTSTHPIGATAGTATPDVGPGTLHADATTGAVHTPDGTLVEGLAHHPTTDTTSTETDSTGSADTDSTDTGTGSADTDSTGTDSADTVSSALPAADSGNGAIAATAGTATPDVGPGTLYADSTTGAVYTPDGTLVEGLAYDPTTDTITDITTAGIDSAGTVSPALLSAADNGSGAIAATAPADPPIDEAAMRAALATLTPDEQQQLAAAGALPIGLLSGPVPTAAPVPDDQGRGPDRGLAQPDQIALQNLLTIAGAALNGSTDGSEGNVGDLLRRAGIKVALDYAGRTVTELTGTEDWARGATPGLGALLNGATSGEGMDWQQVQEAAISGLAAEGIRQLGSDLESGVIDGIAPAGGAAIGQLLSPDGLTGGEIGGIGEDLAIRTVENVIKNAAPGAAGALAAGGVGSILGMFADPDNANPVHFFSALANAALPGAGLALTPLANWYAKEKQRREFEQQMEELNAQAQVMGMNAVSQFRDPTTMQPLTLSDGTTFQWANGLPVLDPNTGQLRPYGTAYYQDGMNTINQMIDIGGAIPHAARAVQEAEAAEIQANLAAGLNPDGTPRTRQQQGLINAFHGKGRTMPAPDPATIPVEYGTAGGWRAHAIAVQQNEDARALDPTHAAAGLSARETDARADAAEAAADFNELFDQQRWAMAGPRYGGGRVSRIIDPPPMPDADQMARLRVEAIRNAAALALAQSPLADDAQMAFEPSEFPCDPEGWDEEQCGPNPANSSSRMPMDEAQAVPEIGSDDVQREVEAPSAETQQIAAEITAARTRLNTPQVTADYRRVVEGPCGQDGHAGQVNCYSAWNELLHPYGGEIPYSTDIARVMAQGHAVYEARKELLGHNVLRDQRTYIMGAPLQPQVPGPQVTA